MFRRSLGGKLSSHSGNPPRTEDTGRFTVTKKCGIISVNSYKMTAACPEARWLILEGSAMPKPKWNLNAIYTSERLQESLRPISHCTLTTVIAPMLWQDHGDQLVSGGARKGRTAAGHPYCPDESVSDPQHLPPHLRAAGRPDGRSRPHPGRWSERAYRLYQPLKKTAAKHMLMDFSSLYITTKMRLTLTCEPHFCYCVSFVLKNVEIAGFSSFHSLRFHIICFRTYEPVHCAGF